MQKAGQVDEGDDRPNILSFKKRKGDIDYELVVKLILQLIFPPALALPVEQQDMLAPAGGCILV